jgi:hypothetical protein
MRFSKENNQQKIEAAPRRRGGRRPYFDWDNEIKPMYFELREYHGDYKPFDKDWSSQRCATHHLMKEIKKKFRYSATFATTRGYVGKFEQEFSRKQKSEN